MSLQRVSFFCRSYGKGYAATGHLMAELAENLSGNGRDVNVFCPPHEWFQKDYEACGVKVGLARLWAFPALVSEARNGGCVILTDSSKWLVFLIPFLRIFSGFKSIFWCMDIPFEKVIRRSQSQCLKLVYECVSWAWFRALNSSDRIIVIGECMREVFARRGVGNEKLQVIGVCPVDQLSGRGISSVEARRKFQAPEKFTVMYSGFAAEWHAFDQIRGLVNAFANDENVQFAFAGDGPGLDSIRDLRPQGNVLFLPRCSIDQLPEFLSMGDIHLVGLSKDMLGVCVPSKIYAAMALERPVLFLGPRESQAAMDIEKFHAGKCLELSAIEDLKLWIHEIREGNYMSQSTFNAVSYRNQCYSAWNRPLIPVWESTTGRA